MMRALTDLDGRVQVTSKVVPVPAPGEVLVRTTAASFCSADLACLSNGTIIPDGMTLGHEAVGVVQSVGGGVTEFGQGQRVAVASGTSCGRCANCQRGFGGHCGGEAHGAYSSGVRRDGSMAEYFTVPNAAYNLCPIPDSVSDAAAVCATDTLATGTTGAECARIPLGGVVTVFGQGHVGLGATIGARLQGAGLVIVVRARPGQEAISRVVGADYAFNLAEHDVVAEVRALTDGQGADCTIEASGDSDSFPRAISATRLGGSITVLSSYDDPARPDMPIPLSEWGWGIGDKTIYSPFARTGGERLSRILRLIKTGRIDTTPLTTHRFGFAEVEQAFAELAARPRDMVKAVITFDTDEPSGSGSSRSRV